MLGALGSIVLGTLELIRLGAGNVGTTFYVFIPRDHWKAWKRAFPSAIGAFLYVFNLSAMGSKC